MEHNAQHSNLEWREVYINLDDLKPCIYQLYDGDDLVYVGQTKHGIFSRISSHIKTKRFTRVLVANVDKKHLDETEAMLILTNSPKYNRTIPLNSRYVTFQGFKRYFNKGVDPMGGKRINLTDIKKSCALSNVKPIGRIMYGKEYYDKMDLLTALDIYIRGKK